MTEWPQYTSLDRIELGRIVRVKRVVDGRNALDAAAWKAAGWTYGALAGPTSDPMSLAPAGNRRRRVARQSARQPTASLSRPTRRFRSARA